MWAAPAACPATFCALFSPEPCSTPTPPRPRPRPAVRVPLVDALCGGSALVDTLDGRRLSFKLPPPPGAAGGSKAIPNEGMPISKAPGKKGSLVVKVEVALPALSDDKKAQLRALLPSGV